MSAYGGPSPCSAGPRTAKLNLGTKGGNSHPKVTNQLQLVHANVVPVLYPDSRYRYGTRTCTRVQHLNSCGASTALHSTNPISIYRYRVFGHSSSQDRIISYAPPRIQASPRSIPHSHQTYRSSTCTSTSV